VTLATRRFRSTCAARGAIAFGIWTAGRRPSLGRRCASVAVLRRLLLRFSSTTTREPCCSRSGERTARFLGVLPRRRLGAHASPGDRALERFAQDNRIRVPEPQGNLQKKLVRTLPNGHEFVAYVDAIGTLDGQERLLEWKTTSARYPDQPEGLTSLDLQLVCYSWITGISDVAIVAFVRKRIPEIQYLLASISEEQRREFGQLVEATVGQIETAQFPSHPGIRFPQNGCVSCAHLGLCLGNEPLVQAKLIRQPGASDLDWLNGLDD
jgi:hypothetical protein